MNILGADAVEIVLADVDPSIRYVKPIGENRLVDDNFVGRVGMLNSVNRTFSRSVYRRYANIGCVHAGS